MRSAETNNHKHAYEGNRKQHKNLDWHRDSREVFGEQTSLKIDGIQTNTCRSISEAKWVCRRSIRYKQMEPGEVSDEPLNAKTGGRQHVTKGETKTEMMDSRLEKIETRLVLILWEKSGATKRRHRPMPASNSYTSAGR
ncbi:hypothetical protein AtEden1_Chr2g0230901 [Arabidopsis thaliana]